jgi:N-methylhydantoinase B/oxoprolinase/acetone carboxylase alpha subunit
MVEAFDKRSTSKWSNVLVKPGDRVRLSTPGGGGWGSPKDRDPDRVAEDLREGWVSADAAARDYGCDGSEG